MKKAFLASLSLLLPFFLFAYCSMPVTLANSDIPCVSGLSTDPSKVHAYLWIQGKADWTTDGTAQVAAGNCAAGGNIGGCDSDGLGSVDTACTWGLTDILMPWRAECVGEDIPGAYGIFQTWEVGSFDGCPSADSSERAVLLIYDDDGKYVLQSRSQGAGWDNWDEIGTSAAGSSLPWYGGGYWNGDYLCMVINNQYFYGNYSSGDAPSSPPSGIRLYFYGGCDYPPSDFSTSAWVAGDVYQLGTGSTTTINLHVSDLPVFTSRALVVSVGLNFEGKDMPFISPAYWTATPPAYGNLWTQSGCGCGIVIEPAELGSGNVPSCCPFPEWLLDGTTIKGMPPDECNVEHCFQWRWNFGNWVSCWSEEECITDTAGVPQPSKPVITSITDNDPNANTGVTINFTPGTPVLRHDLYGDGYLIQTNFTSGSTVNGLECNISYSFKIAAISDPECWTIYSNPIEGTDGCVSAPGELAQGATSGDALLFSNDKTTASWPSYTGATGYRLYRGTQADLVNLPGGAVDNSCLKYDGASTSVDLSGDTPASESFFWYLVTAYNGAGEGPAGTGRIINSSGGCP